MCIFEFKNKEIQIGTAACANQALEFEGQASLRRHLSWLSQVKPRILKSNELLQPSEPFSGFLIIYQLAARTLISGGICLCQHVVCTLAFLLG